MCDTIEIKKYSSSRDFLQETETFLEKNALQNNLLIGISRNLLLRESSPDHYFISILENGRVVGSAIKTGPKLLLSLLKPDKQQINKLIDFVKAEKMNLAGVHAEPLTAELFASALGVQVVGTNTMVVHELVQLKNDVATRCEFRAARKVDNDIVLNYLCQYEMEVHTFPKRSRGELSHFLQMLLDKEDTVFVLRSGTEIVCMAVFIRNTQRIGIIGYVYTPMNYRNKGFATQCVRELSRHILNKGFNYCGLFADKSNAGANKMYRTIGYEANGELSDLDFLPLRF